MKEINTTDKHLKAEIYAEIINDRLAMFFRYIQKHGDNNDEINEIKDKLARAHHVVKIYPDEEHFQKWQALIDEADVALAKAKIFA